jgi:purine-binding chemotaxis protein CheW
MGRDSPTVEVDFAALTRRLDEAERLIDRKPTAEQRKVILAVRARALCQSRELQQVESVDVLAFRVGGERYAVPIEQVDQVVEPRQLSVLPGVPRYVLGAMVARSRVIVVIDLRQILGLEGGGMSDLTQVVVLALGDARFGVAAESVDGRLAMPTTGATRAFSGPFSLIAADRLALIDIAELARTAAATRGDS